MNETKYHKKGIINELLERISILESRVNEMERTSSNRYYTLDEFCELTGYSKNTMYKKIKLLKINKHYFKPNGGKLIFDESSLDFLIKGENQSGKSIQESRHPVSIDEYFKSLDIK